MIFGANRSAGKRSADDQFGDAIAVDVARAADRAAGFVTRCGTLDHKIGAVRGIGQIDGAGQARRAKHHIAGALGRVGTRCADDQIVDAIAIDVTRAAHRPAGNVQSRGALDGQIGVSGEVDGHRKALIGAEHHVAGAGTVAAVRGGVRHADDQIIDAIAVDVARAADRAAGFVKSRGALDGQVGVAREVDGRRKALIAAEHHVAGAGKVTAIRVGSSGADDHIVDAIAVDVARATDREAGKVNRSGALDSQLGVGGEVDGRRKALIAAEHHVDGTGIARPFGSAR